MRGASRAAFASGQRALESALSSGADWSALAEELFSVIGVLDSSASLRRALADPSRVAAARSGLVRSLLGGKVSDPTVGIVAELAAQRWSEERDLPDAVEQLAVETVVATADAGGRLDSVEDELFRFDRLVAGTSELREAVAVRGDSGQSARSRDVLVTTLLRGKVAPESLRLARQAVLAPRGRRFDRTMALYLSIAARRREQLTATVTAAVPLDDSRRHRLAEALGSIYGRQVQVNVSVDPEVVGGIRIQLGDDIIDGTILRRLDEARRAMTG